MLKKAPPPSHAPVFPRRSRLSALRSASSLRERRIAKRGGIEGSNFRTSSMHSTIDVVWQAVGIYPPTINNPPRIYRSRLDLTWL